MKKTILLAILLIHSFYCFSQSNIKVIDSIKQIVKSEPSDSLKIKAFSDLCWYYRNVSKDSAFVYGNLALKLSKKTKNLQGEAQAYNDLGIIYYGLSDFNSSINHYKKSLVIRTSLIDSMGMASLFNKLGISYQRTFKIDSSIYFSTEALKIYEAKNHLKYITVIKNNIANIYQNLKQHEKALKAHLEVAETCERINDLKGLVRSYTNIGNSYLFLQDTIQTIKYYKKGIALALEQDHKKGLATLYNNYGGILKNQGRYKEAIHNISKSLKLRKELNDNYGVSSSSLNLAGLYLDNGNIEKIKDHLYLGLELAEKSDANELKIDAYDKLSLYYAFKNNADSVSVYKLQYKTLQDSIYSKDVVKEVAEVQEKYDTAQREKEILLQRADIAEKELHLNQKNTQLIGLGVLAIVISLLGYLLYNQQKLKNHQLKKESELNEALVKIETHNKLQEQRIRISRDLHDNIGAQLTFIISSIDNLKYGYKITNDKLTNKLGSISEFTKETIYELRDTIWAMNKNEISLEDLQVRISNFIDKADFASTETKFDFNIDSELLAETQFTSLQGMNMYRIIQEAINNSFKYAESKNVKVQFKKSDNLFEVSIVDDGKGFNFDEVELGNGLNNMKKRAQEIGSDIEIKSELNKGTKIVFTI